MWSLFKRQPPAPRERWALTTPLFYLSQAAAWTIADACQGTQVFGSTGSGKSTGPMAMMIQSFLAAGFGGLFLVTKPQDRAVYEQFCRRQGRSTDLLIFGPHEPLRYNPIDAELRRTDAGAGLTENIVALLSTVLEVSERDKGQSSGEEGSYFRRTNRQLVRNSVDLLVLAKNRLTIADLYRLVISAPVSLEQTTSENWRSHSFCWECLREADAKPKTDRQKEDLKLVADYFLVEFANLSSRTRSVVLSTFTSMVDVLNRSVIRELMGGPVTNVTPEMAQEGSIILIDMPVKIYGELGVFAQVVWKYCFQQAMERRDTLANPRPVFIVCDESHLLAVSSDQIFQTTARSSRTAVLYATQSVSNYLATFGSSAEAEVHSLLGNLQTQVFCQQADIKTNAYAAELIGRSRQFLVNSSNSYQPQNWWESAMGMDQPQVSAGVSEVFEWEVQPRTFATLRKGGPPTWEVDSIVYQGGRRFSGTGKPWMEVTFPQQV